jgi:hypothetical protein
MPDDWEKAGWVPSFMRPPQSDQPPPTSPPFFRPPVLPEDAASRILWDKALRQSIRENRLYRARHVLAVMAWVIVAVLLAVIAFGLPHLPRGGWLVVSLAHAHDAGRLIAFAGLGVLLLFGANWLWMEIRNRHSMEAIGIFLTCAGIAGALVVLGAAVLSIDIAGWVGTILVVGSAALFFGGLRVIRENPPAPPPQPAAGPRGRDYDRKEVTVHGDARSADDWEIDDALRTKSGGFDPMFKD